jgi:radical SAM superfamily enzyme YgiQ (UPF0313 family)
MAMRITLVFPPSVSPSCIPLGIASLKAFIEKDIAGANVSLLDLNLSFMNRILSGQCHDLHNICKEGNVVCKGIDGNCFFKGSLTKGQKAIFKKAKTVPRDKRLFFDREIFRLFFGDCYNYTRSFNDCISKIIINYLSGKLSDSRIIRNLFSEELKGIESTRPDMLGFSILVNKQLLYSLALAKMIKESFDMPVVFGGPALSCYNLDEFASTFDFIDFIVLREGEEAIVGLLKMMNVKSFSRIPNLIWRKGRVLVFNKNRCIKDLNLLPTPDFHGLELKEYFSPELILPLATARGCPWSRCKFCQLNMQYSGGYRERTIENVISDIRYLKDSFCAENFFITDSEVSSHRLRKLSDSITKARLKIYFACYVRPTKDLNLKTLKTVYRAGGRFFQLGVETFSQRLLNFINKGTTVSSIKGVLEHTYRLGIKNLVYMISCIPTQTKKELSVDLGRIVNLQKKYGIFSVVYCLYSLGVNQPFYRMHNDLGIVIRSKGRRMFTVKNHNIKEMSKIKFSYKDRGAYDILDNLDDKKIINSYDRACIELLEFCDKSGLNNENKYFLLLVNNFLFETQLIFSKRENMLPFSPVLKEKICGFYLRNKSHLLYKRAEIN